LAEPNLTSLNGQPANFLVGGEFPILESTSTVAAVNQSIRFIPFGVQLTVIPTVSDGDRIRLNLSATVSEQVGAAAGGNGGGTGGNDNTQNDPSQPPSLSTRSFQTTVELRSSESLAVAGLIRTSLINSSVRVPFLGDIPIVGSLFSNNRNSYQEQELILVVTPQLVSPIPAGGRQPLPGSDSFEADDLQFFIHGNVAGDIAEDYRTPVRSDLEKMHAFRHAEQKYIIGRPGHTSGQVLPLPKSNLHQSVEVKHGPQ
jgi:pilus assembly protein CpaC